MYHSEAKFTCITEMYDDISFRTLTNERFWCRLNFKKNVKNRFSENFTLSNQNPEKNLDGYSTLRVSRAEIWLMVYRLIYIIRMQEGFDSYWVRALKYFFLPCNPAGKINSLYNNENYLK